MTHKPTLPRRALAAAVACAPLALVAGHALAAPEKLAAPSYGQWEERDHKLQFEIQPGAKPDKLVLVMPQDVAFPGSHRFILARQADGAFKAEDAGRPAVTLSFTSPSQASLKIRGAGSTKRETWLTMNDYLLVRR